MDPEVPAAMVQMLFSFQLPQALYVITKLGIPDLLVGGPLSAEDLAAAVGAQPGPLWRLLRTLASVGLFEEVGEHTVALKPLGATLATDQPGSMRDLAIMLMETHYAPFGELLYTVRTGEPAANRYYGAPFFAWLAQDPDRVALFSGAMANMTSGIKLGALSSVELDGARVVVDVGGSDGTVLTVLLGRHPEMRGLVFDLPHVVGAVAKVAADSGLAGRLEAVGGDFFDSVPAGDTYLFSVVLHDWADDEASCILRNVRAAGGPESQLRIVDFVVPPGDEPHMSKMIDLTMLAMVTGRERTAAEWSEVLGDGGWAIDRIVATPTPLSVIEASAR